MTQAVVQLTRRRFGETMRRDAWWIQPLVVFVVLGAFLVYATWAAFQNAHYTYGPYLSPFYSPLLFGDPPHAWFGRAPGWLASISPALLILPLPGGFRVTCYYYRGAYYKAFWADPVSCAVGEPRNGYRGERYLPLVLQNVHRYFLYFALLISALNTYDAVMAFRSPTGFGFGLGNVIMVVNVALLWSYTLGCHSCRHITAGRINHFSRHPVRYWLWQRVSWLNARHMQFAWITLGTLVLTDAYIALVSAGVIHDLRFVG